LTVLLELGPNSHEVFEDPVVNDRDLAVEASVRVGVFFGGLAVRRPARVTDAGAGREGVAVELSKLGFETGESIGTARDFDLAGVEERDACTVVSAVLEVTETLQQDGDGFTRTDVSDDSAHIDDAPFES
jgi:hypothetical protein